MIAPERSGGASYSGSGVSNDPSVRSLCVYKKAKIPRMVSASVTVSIYNSDFISRFSRCRRKVLLRGEGMICRDPKKVDFFHLLIIQIVLNYAVLDRSGAHSSRPRTYLPSRSGATHALRVQSSYFTFLSKNLLEFY